MNTDVFLKLYEHMVCARRIDELEESLAHRGDAPFHVPGSGHEGTAALAPHLTSQDWLHCHYRDRALVLARGASIESFFTALFAKATSKSGGRRMPGFPGDSSLNLLSAPTLVGNNALQAVGVAAAIKARDGNPIVLCSIGDGGTQEGEVFEAIAESVRSSLPVLFLIEDNRFALSTRTEGKTFYSLPGGNADSFYGLPLQYQDGSRVVDAFNLFEDIVSGMRKDRQPRLLVFQVERLTSHTNADDQTIYRTAEEIESAKEKADPIRHLKTHLLNKGISEEQLREIEERVTEEVQAAMEVARLAPEPQAELDARKPLNETLLNKKEQTSNSASDDSHTMLEALRGTLHARLAKDARVSLYGEDIEDPKGDVFGLTRGLSTDFPDRVTNSPLAEATIVGSAIGRALAGERPVALMQFADFLPVAYNQIYSELGNMYWRTKGDWEVPVVVMGVCGAYRPGLGPFHAQTPVATSAHTPGVDVFVPSTAGDAAGLLNAAFESGRPSLFYYPKALLNDRARMTSGKLEDHFVPIGKARIAQSGDELTMVSWGSTMPICEQVAETLTESGVGVELIDLRTISPWDRETVVESARKTSRLLVVHEDHYTCGMGGEIIAAASEDLGNKVTVARISQADTYIPYHFGNQLEVLPSYKSVLTKAAEMLDMQLTWRQESAVEEGFVTVNAIGSSPSDETIQFVEIHVSKGESVRVGQLLASVEADKAAAEISSPAEGTVEELLLEEGDSVEVGTPFLRIRAEEKAVATHQIENPGTPLLERRKQKKEEPTPVPPPSTRKDTTVILSSIERTVGSRLITNEDLLKEFPQWDSEYIRKRTGAEYRYWIGENESVLTLAVDACRKLLEREKLSIEDIDGIVCSTGTPLSATPSMACRILNELTKDNSGEIMMQAHDVNAACTGFLYALQQAYDILKSSPAEKLLVVTSEALSTVLNKQDPGTCFLFGDAATASLVSCERRSGNIGAGVHRPVLSAVGAEERTLYVPFGGTGEYMEMDGQPVFKIAVNKMNDMMERACARSGITIEDLDMIVPHQANERIIHAIRKSISRNLHFPNEKMFNHIREYGNTSSNTIPLALSALIPSAEWNTRRVGLCAFGGGFTFGAAVMDIL